MKVKHIVWSLLAILYISSFFWIDFNKFEGFNGLLIFIHCLIGFVGLLLLTAGIACLTLTLKDFLIDNWDTSVTAIKKKKKDEKGS